LTRTFVAADIDEAFLDGAAAIPISFGRKVRRESMHATLFFFGEIDDARIAELSKVVEALPADPIPLRATRLDAYPTPSRARVLVLPLEDDGSLERLHERFGTEDRPFRPHVTLARFKVPAAIEGFVATTPVSFEGRVVSVTLYKSKLGKDSPTYTPLARRALSA
jgi:2'-5' RNA ligase